MYAVMLCMGCVIIIFEETTKKTLLKPLTTLQKPLKPYKNLTLHKCMLLCYVWAASSSSLKKPQQNLT